MEGKVIEDDFKRAEEIYSKIVEKIGKPGHDLRPILFCLVLIYVRQLKHHEYEERLK